jgi:hypothetical protein
VIDSREQVERLLDKLRASLPLSASASPELGAEVRRTLPGVESKRCRITRVDYAGDEGGIMCQLDFGPEKSRFFVSITYLQFAGAAALSREITAYQRRRFKRLRRLDADRVGGPLRG